MERSEFIDYRELSNNIKKLEADLKKLRSRREGMEPTVLELMSQLGVTSVKVGTSTIYLHRQLWANAQQDEDGNRDYQGATDALIEAGFPEMVEKRFNVMRVSALIREMDKEDDINPVLAESLNITERVQARVRG